MTIEELDKKIERIRAVSNAKMQFLKDRMKTLDSAFEEIEHVQEAEIEVLYDKIR